MNRREALRTLAAGGTAGSRHPCDMPASEFIDLLRRLSPDELRAYASTLRLAVAGDGCSSLSRAIPSPSDRAKLLDMAVAVEAVAQLRDRVGMTERSR